MANLLSLNFDKTNFMHFTSKSKTKIDINITYNNMQIIPLIITNFLEYLLMIHCLGKHILNISHQN
jgi:hypothetical protein